jgi:hypothetical protein
MATAFLPTLADFGIPKRVSANAAACGGMIEKDEPRLSFLITGKAGEDREAHMHRDPCSTAQNLAVAWWTMFENYSTVRPSAGLADSTA